MSDPVVVRPGPGLAHLHYTSDTDGDNQSSPASHSSGTRAQKPGTWQYRKAPGWPHLAVPGWQSATADSLREAPERWQMPAGAPLLSCQASPDLHPRPQG